MITSARDVRIEESIRIGPALLRALAEDERVERVGLTLVIAIIDDHLTTPERSGQAA